MKPVTIDPASLAPIAQGTLKKTGEKYYVGFLDEGHINEIKAFHDHIVKTLNPDEQAFFLQKPRSFFANHFKKGNGNAVLAIVKEDGAVIAQAIILNPSYTSPDTGMVDMDLSCRTDSITVLQGVGVLPEMRGNGLMHDLVSHWLDYAYSLGKTNAIAEIDVNNIASWNVFLKEGLKLVGMGIDPSDGTLVYNAHEDVKTAIMKRLSHVFNDKAVGPLFASHIENIEWHQKLFKEGQKCIGFNKAQKTLVFEAANDLKPEPEKKEPELTWFQLTR